jgi:golgi phosphoprotein 3
MSSAGLTRRRGAGGAAATTSDGGEAGGSAAASRTVRDSAPETNFENTENGHKIAYDPRDLNESAERSKQPKLTLMEEVLLLGLKDKQVRRKPTGAPCFLLAAPAFFIGLAESDIGRGTSRWSRG